MKGPEANEGFNKRGGGGEATMGSLNRLLFKGV